VRLLDKSHEGGHDLVVSALGRPGLSESTILSDAVRATVRARRAGSAEGSEANARRERPEVSSMSPYLIRWCDRAVKTMAEAFSPDVRTSPILGERAM
jgi:hypothetical protein